MSNAEFYACDGTKCSELGHGQFTMDSFDFSKMLDCHGHPASTEDLAPIVIVFVSKGWCKYCCRVSPVLDRIQAGFNDQVSFVIQNYSFVEKPFQEEGFKTFMEDKSFYNMNYEPQSEAELKQFRLFLRDHSIEFPALFIFDRKTRKLITNDGYTHIRSVFDLSRANPYWDNGCVCTDEFKNNVLAKWEQIAIEQGLRAAE